MPPTNFSDDYKIPLNAFEEYMLLDDRPGYPMTMPTTLVFRGRVDFELLSRAFGETIASEPFYRSIVRKERGRWHWVPAETRPALLDCSEESPSPRGESGVEPIFSLDLRREPGVRCEYRTTSDGFAIRLQVHHAICDGLAVMRFAGNWFGRYGELIGDTEGVGSCFPDPSRLSRREDFQIVLPHPLSRWTIAKSFFREASHWFFRRPSRLRPLPEGILDENPTGTKTDSSGTPRLYWTKLPVEFFDAHRAAAKRRKLSANTLFLGDYFRTIDRWLEKSRSGGVSPRRWIRVLMPTNLRKSCHADMPAANMLGYAFFDRRVADCKDRETLYAGLHADVELVKTWSMGSMFLAGVDACRSIPGGLPLATSKRFCHSTSVFSNIGCPCKTLLQRRFHRAGTIRVGDAELLQLIGGPPMRPNTPFTGGMLLQDRTWTVSIISDPSRMSDAETLLFRDMLIGQFNETAE